MFCKKCGIKFDDNSTFCPDCGEKAEKIEDKEFFTTNETEENHNKPQSPFREDFYKFIKSFSFLLLVIFATVYYTVNVINSFFHFSSSDIMISVVGLLYALISLGLTIPSLWMLFTDRSPHSTFVPIKLYAFINCLKIFLLTSFGVLSVISAKMGKEGISHTILYLAEENLSLYLVILLSQTIKNPSFMLLSTSSILWLTYLFVSISYNISLIRFLNSTSKRINKEDVFPIGYKMLFGLSFFIATLHFIYAFCLYVFIKSDIYNVLTVMFGGIFHMMMCVNLRNFGKIFCLEEEKFSEE